MNIDWVTSCGCFGADAGNGIAGSPCVSGGAAVAASGGGSVINRDIIMVARSEKLGRGRLKR